MAIPKKTLASAAQSAFGYSYLAWYADVNHAIQPVTSGYRLVLTYNLVYSTSDFGHRASLLDDHKLNLGRVLSTWRSDWTKDPEGSEKLIYLLEHEYSEANISLDLLKGKDKSRLQFLAAACRDQGFCLYFAHFEHTKYEGAEEEYHCHGGYYDQSDGVHEIISICEEKWTLTNVFTDDGKVLASDISIDQRGRRQRRHHKALRASFPDCAEQLHTALRRASTFAALRLETSKKGLRVRCMSRLRPLPSQPHGVGRAVLDQR